MTSSEFTLEKDDLEQLNKSCKGDKKKTGPKMKYPQGHKDTCVFAFLASALHALNEKKIAAHVHSKCDPEIVWPPRVYNNMTDAKNIMSNHYHAMGDPIVRYASQDNRGLDAKRYDVLTFDNRVCPFHLILLNLMLSSLNCTQVLPLYLVPVKSQKQRIKADVTNDVRKINNDRSAPKPRQRDKNRETKKQNREGESNHVQDVWLRNFSKTKITDSPSTPHGANVRPSHRRHKPSRRRKTSLRTQQSPCRTVP